MLVRRACERRRGENMLIIVDDSLARDMTEYKIYLFRPKNWGPHSHV